MARKRFPIMLTLLRLFVPGLTIAALLGACASPGPVHPGLAPASEPAATLVLIRDAAGARAHQPVQVLLDDQPVAALTGGHWSRMRIRPGLHAFEAASVDDPARRPNFQSSQPGYVRETGGVAPSKAVRLELRPDETHYVLLRYDRTDTSRTREGQGIVEDTRVLFAVEQMAESTARRHMEGYDEVSIEHP